jgi:hypothetical protein
VPTATVCTNEFTSLARQTATSLGLPSLPLVIIPHPLSGLNPPQVQAKAEQAVEDIIRALTTPTLIGQAQPAFASEPASLCTDEVCALDEATLRARQGESLFVEDSLVGAAEASQLFYEQGWTDGLPIIPPTRTRVDEMVHWLGRLSDEVIGLVPPRQGRATLEKLAINAVMAGCRPEHFPVVVTAVEAMLEPSFDLAGVQATTGPHAPLIIVNGPITRTLDINSETNAFGPGRESNAVIGRALRLVLLNIGGGIPGTVDKATQGQPSKYTYCIAENEEANPWEPLQVERGFDRATSTVTVVACHSPVNIHDTASTTARGILTTAADTMATLGGSKLYRSSGEVFLLLCPEHAAIIARYGWNKDDVRHFLFEKARRPLCQVKRGGMYGPEVYWPKWLNIEDKQAMVPLVERVRDIVIVVVGGTGRHSSFLITWSASRSVTRTIS